MNNIERFVDQFVDYIESEYPTQYSAGHIIQRYGDFIIAEEQAGARETFSIGQPVYDKDGNPLGYLGIGLYENLDYAVGVRVPVEYWRICLPTQDCVPGKKVYTYWQYKEMWE